MSAFDLKDPQGRPASVYHATPYGAYRHDAAVMVDEMGVAHIGAAHEGIRAIITILQQREVDMDMDGEALALSSNTVQGLLNALACCVDFAEMHATGTRGAFDTHRFDCDTTDHLAIMRAAVAATKGTAKAAGQVSEPKKT